MVLLELKYLCEIKKITKTPEAILAHLKKNIGLKVCDKSFLSIIDQAKHFAWTRDPFDRIITAHASVDGDVLLTRDAKILEHYEHSLW